MRKILVVPCHNHLIMGEADRSACILSVHHRSLDDSWLYAVIASECMSAVCKSEIWGAPHLENRVYLYSDDGKFSASVGEGAGDVCACGLQVTWLRPQPMLGRNSLL